METHPLTVEIKNATAHYNSKLYKLFYVSYALIHFDLFFPLHNFFFHLYFSIEIIELCFLQA